MIPGPLVGGVIGKGGKTIKQLNENTGAEIKFINQDECYRKQSQQEDKLLQ